MTVRHWASSTLRTVVPRPIDIVHLNVDKYTGTAALRGQEHACIIGLRVYRHTGTARLSAGHLVGTTGSRSDSLAGTTSLGTS